jgi:hypothetical protein
MGITKRKHVLSAIQFLRAAFLRRDDPANQEPIGDLEFHSGILLVAMAAVAFGFPMHGCTF